MILLDLSYTILLRSSQQFVLLASSYLLCSVFVSSEVWPSVLVNQVSSGLALLDGTFVAVTVYDGNFQFLFMFEFLFMC